MIFGKASSEISGIIESEIIKHVDDVSTLAKPILFMAGKINDFESAKERIATSMAANAIESSFHFEEYLGEALELEKMMGDRMSSLPPNEFESILRSAFQEDEMLLILVGAH